MASSSPSDLTLDCKVPAHSNFTPSKSFGDQQLEDFLSRLEDERLKIDAFKRELPLCMQLLTNALEASRQQLQACRGNQGSRPVLEEFMPLKNSTCENLGKSLNISDHKANWMTTAQLWSQEGTETKQQSLITSPKDTDIGLNVNPNLGLDTKQRIGGAFVPFSKDQNCSSETDLPDLALASLNKDMEDRKCSSETENGVSCKGADNNTSDGKTSNSNTSQPNRKARRCWSPDLHRRFVNALQMLGGSQVATPKQIRELMKVDGLTNDEVKSHLQKYRLHTRRPSPIPQVAGAPAPQLVVLGGIWVPPEYATAAHGGATALYGAHHPAAPRAPPHFQEFYTVAATPTLPPPDQLHHHQFHNIYNAASRARRSPEPNVREAVDRSESIEDGKSESGSWKGESGGDQRIGLAALREEGEESNRSEITLRF